MALDLVWLDERLVVELDGPEHRTPLQFEADRRRDVLLALDGYTVVRFTNESVDDDIQHVVSQLQRLVQNHRDRSHGG
jgi:very-short-patch-repair endonuclease